jgi:hypothetical protein
MDFKKEYVEVGQIDFTEPDSPEVKSSQILGISFTPAAARIYKLQLEERMYKAKFENSYEPFLITVTGSIKSRNITVAYELPADCFCIAG